MPALFLCLPPALLPCILLNWFFTRLLSFAFFQCPVDNPLYLTINTPKFITRPFLKGLIHLFIDPKYK